MSYIPTTIYDVLDVLFRLCQTSTLSNTLFYKSASLYIFIILSCMMYSNWLMQGPQSGLYAMLHLWDRFYRDIIHDKIKKNTYMERRINIYNVYFWRPKSFDFLLIRFEKHLLIRKPSPSKLLVVFWKRYYKYDSILNICKSLNTK